MTVEWRGRFEDQQDDDPTLVDTAPRRREARYR